MSIDWSYPAALVVGASLSVTGTVLQSVLRNPLAEPYLMGTVGGGALFAASATVFGLTALGAWVMPAASFLGSCCALAIVCVVAFFAARSRQAESASPLLRASGSTLVLAGFVTGGFLGSLDMLVLSYAKSEDFASISKWLYGSLTSVTPAIFLIGVFTFALTFIVLYAIAHEMDVLELGRNEAECLGINARKLIVIVLASTSLMTAVSVALAGAVGFVGLVVPHVVRRLTGPRMRRLLPRAALTGGLFLCAAQGLVRALPGEIPVGVICAIVGGPLLFALLISRRNGEGWDV